MKLSVVIPARDEAGVIADTVSAVAGVLDRESIEYEVIVVDDASTDGTSQAAEGANTAVRCIRLSEPGGFGIAVRAGLEDFTGDAVAILMADGSDDPEDLVSYHRVLTAGHDCAFGSRFTAGGLVVDYPRFKLLVNRAVNHCIRILFRHGYDDTTNAFKAYRREVIEGIQPLLSKHFNLTVEMPLKALVRGFSFEVVPVSWRNRRWGETKLSLHEMGSRYLFIVLYVLLERHLSRGDYLRSSS